MHVKHPKMKKSATAISVYICHCQGDTHTSGLSDEFLDGLNFHVDFFLFFRPSSNDQFKSKQKSLLQDMLI